MKGSLTIEAALVIPFCFVILGIVSFLGIFQYNQVVLKMTAYECILQTDGEEIPSEAVLKKLLTEQAKEKGNARGLAVKDLEVTVNVTVSKITLTYRCTQALLNLPVEVTVVYERTFPELTLRLI